MGEGQAVHVETEPAAEEGTIETLFQGLWERVRAAGELIVELRSQRTQANLRMAELEGEIRRLRAELAEREEVVKSFKDVQAAKAQSDGKILSNGEREALAEKARKLLERIQDYL
jgi:hypothetical protein